MKFCIMSLIVYEAIFLLTLCLKVTVAELPSSCLTSLTSSSSMQCCQTSPFLEISFKLRFGCDVPTSLEQGIRLEIWTSTNDWQPVRFYTPSLFETNSTIVRLLGNNTVTAEALRYSSNFSLELVEGNQQIQFREYICDPAFLVDGVSVRWMQRFMGISHDGVGTWSLDDITLTVWNGVCRHVVLRNSFDTEIMSNMYKTLAGNVTNLSCDTPNNQQLYFRKEAFRAETSRRSLTISDLPLHNTAVLCTAEGITGAGSCNASECDDGRSVCSIGSAQCESCSSATGYIVPRTVGSCLDINECEESNGNCEQMCVNKPGSYHCECRDGFTLSDNGFSCNDFDECSIPENNNCEQNCTNNDGSYSCSCINGYTLLSNGFQCEDVNECTQAPNVCHHNCLNTNGSFECVCMDGYVLDDNDGRTCADIDECLTTKHRCEQGCSNNAGSFVCVCNRGYTLSPDGQNCTDINECESGVCGQFCHNTAGSYECTCMNGFTPAADRRTCDDIDECSSPLLNNCDGTCLNTNGSYQCNCTPGFSLSPDSFSCQDIDECLSSEQNCESICINTNGSFQCNCLEGFSLLNNGFSCQDIDECSDSSLHVCQHICVNSPGSYSCDCLTGFSLSSNGFSCQDIDECESSDLNQCEEQCLNTLGSYQCNCSEGFNVSTDGFSCQDIDECESSDLNQCEEQCLNTLGSYQCNCSEGFNVSTDGFSCQDIDECESSDLNQCEEQCLNTRGSYQCNCSEGFNVSTDGFSCQDIDECESSDLNQCEEQCLNTRGSYQCNCSEGFNVSTDGFSCQDIDECESSDLNQCEEQCLNTRGSYQCNCSEGFNVSTDGFSCQDIDECASSEMNKCNAMSMCNNTLGSYQCICRSGFISVLNGSVCQDVTRQALDEIRNLLNSGDVNSTKIAQLLADLVDRLIKEGQLASRDLSVFLANTVDVFLSNVDTRGGESGADQEAVSSVLTTLDQFALRVYDDSEPKLETDGFQLRVTNGSSRRFEGISIGGNIITLPSDFGKGVKVASFFFKDLSDALPNNPGIDSESAPLEKMPVISSSVLCDNNNCTSNLSDPVRYQIVVNKTENMKLDCVFYNLTTHAWSNESCTRNAELSNSMMVSVCECTHLTHFAILLSPGVNLSEDTNRRLEIIGYVGVSISLGFLVLTILALTIAKSLWGMRNFIHINLCGSLFIAQLLFVTTVGMTDNAVFCQSIAVVLHYAFLVTFMWMLMEGVVLYVVLVQVFVKRPKLYMAFFALVSYGLPLLYLCLTVPLGFALRGPDGKPHYGSSAACWLRYDTLFMWAFISPIILIVLINIGFFIMSVYIMRKHTKRQTQKSHLTSVAQWLKSSVVLLICMGIPWIVGVGIFTENVLAEGLSFIFTIFIGFQGLIIFILFVPLSKQVREAYRKWWRGKLSESEFLSKHFSSSDMDRKSSFFGRLSSFKTSSLRVSKSGTYQSSHADRSSHTDDHDIRLPESNDKSSSQSPPPYEEYVIQSQKVVNVGNGSMPNDTVEKGEHIDGMSVSALQNGSSEHAKEDLSNGIEMDAERKSMFEEQRIKFTDSVPDVREHQIEGTNL